MLRELPRDHAERSDFVAAIRERGFSEMLARWLATSLVRRTGAREGWRYPVDLSVNSALFPDVYSYNFDAVNILTLPLERTSMMGKLELAQAAAPRRLDGAGLLQ